MQDTLCLPSELTIYTVTELRPRWLEWLATLPGADAAADAVCRVDATATDEVDAAGLQLLLSLAHALAREQRTLQLVNTGTALGSACAALGMAHLLDNKAATGNRA